MSPEWRRIGVWLIVLGSLAGLAASGAVSARMPHHQDTVEMNPVRDASALASKGFVIRNLEYVLPPTDPYAAPVVEVVTYDVEVARHQTDVVVRQAQDVTATGARDAAHAFDQLSRKAADANEKTLAGWAHAHGAAIAAGSGLADPAFLDAIAQNAFVGRVQRVTACSGGDADFTGCALLDGYVRGVLEARPR